MNYQPPVITSVAPASGSIGPGSTLTITGTNLGNSTTEVSVLVGGLPCTSVAIVTAFTQITCQSDPSVGGAANIAVTFLDQTSANFSYSFSPPVVSTATKSSSFDMNGGNITITGTSLTSSAQVYLGSALCLDVYAASSSQITCIAPPAGLISLGGAYAPLDLAAADGGPPADVTVKVVIGGVASNTNIQLNLFGDILPVITSVSPTTVSSGTNVTITGANLGNSTSGMVFYLTNSYGTFVVNGSLTPSPVISASEGPGLNASTVVFQAPPGIGNSAYISAVISGR